MTACLRGVACGALWTLAALFGLPALLLMFVSEKLADWADEVDQT